MGGRSFLVVMLALQSAATSANPSPIPTGSGWWCYTSHDQFNVADRAGRCFRHESDCNAARGAWPDADMPTAVVSECREQKNAAVVTYYDVMHDEDMAWVMPSSDLCAETRTYLSRDRDVQRISSCKLVGDLEPPPSLFRVAAVPPGTGWYCTHGTGGLSGCSRSPSVCDAARNLGNGTRGSCALQKNAVAMTWPEYLVSDLSFQAGLNMPSHGFGAFGTTTDCEWWRKHWAPIWSGGLSVCTRVGDVEYPPVDSTQLPEGTGWSCLPAAIKLADPHRDTCFRRAEECRTALPEVTNDVGDSACVTTPSAYVFSTPQGYFAYRTAVECHNGQLVESTPSRCSPIADIASVPEGSGVAPRETTKDDELADTVSETAINEALENVRQRVSACGQKSHAIGTVKLRVSVDPDGSVDRVDVRSTPDPNLGECTANAVRQAEFPRTRRGAEFSRSVAF